MMANGGEYALKSNESEARERLQAFWEGSSFGRPAIHATARNPAFEEKHWDGPAGGPKRLEFTPEWQAHIAVNAVESAIWLAEAMPGYTVCVGGHLPLLAVLVGGSYGYTRDDSGAAWGSAWVEELDGVLDRPVPAFDPEHPAVVALVEALRCVAKALDGRAIAAPPCWVDPLTTLGNLRTEEVLCADLIDRPEQVKAWTAAATTLCLEANEHLYQEARSLGHGECLSWLGVMAEGRMDAVQCDFSIMLSPAMFEQFVVPTLRRQTKYFDFSIYHLDGDENMRFLNLIGATPDLNALQYTRIAGSTYPGRCLDDYRLIRQQGLSLFVSCDDVEDAMEVTKTLGPDGLYIVLPQFDSEGEATQAIERIADAC